MILVMQCATKMLSYLPESIILCSLLKAENYTEGKCCEEKELVAEQGFVGKDRQHFNLISVVRVYNN